MLRRCTWSRDVSLNQMESRFYGFALLLLILFLLILAKVLLVNLSRGAAACVVVRGCGLKGAHAFV